MRIIKFIKYFTEDIGVLFVTFIITLIIVFLPASGILWFLSKFGIESESISKLIKIFAIVIAILFCLRSFFFYKKAKEKRLVKEESRIIDKHKKVKPVYEEYSQEKMCEKCNNSSNIGKAYGYIVVYSSMKENWTEIKINHSSYGQRVGIFLCKQCLESHIENWRVSSIKWNLFLISIIIGGSFITYKYFPTGKWIKVPFIDLLLQDFVLIGLVFIPVIIAGIFMIFIDYSKIFKKKWINKNVITYGSALAKRLIKERDFKDVPDIQLWSYDYYREKLYKKK